MSKGRYDETFAGEDDNQEPDSKIFFMLNSNKHGILQLIKNKMLKINTSFALKLTYIVFILLINGKMPTTIVGITETSPCKKHPRFAISI